MRTSFFLLAAALLLGVLPARATNTVMRFTYYHGPVTVGSMDVELFDEEKPVTVSNFLHYVRSGAYDNLMLHRVVTGFVMQAGALRSPNPLSTAPYAGSYYTPNFGSITNEFNTGPRYSNVVGTIAMARAIPSLPDSVLTNYEDRVAGTNSASTDWFINLGDNSGTLDTNWGGFTVFGRVIAGTHLLSFFATNSAALSTTQVGQLYNLPVAYPATPPRYPRYADLYHVRIADLPATDITRPTVSITYPAAGARLTNLNGVVTGTAGDNAAVRSLWYSLNSPYDFTNIPSGNTWSIPFEFRAGTNYIWVQSVDTAGQRSAFAGRNWFVSQFEPLHLTVIGPGTVSGGTNGQRFEVERPVTLRAVPAVGHIFAGWNGTSNYVPSVAKFLMFTNAYVTATFLPNPFPRLKGSYTGLFYNTNFSVQNGPFPVQPSGGIDLTITDQGKVSGKLRIVGRSLPFSGNISAYGKAILNLPASAMPAYFRCAPNWQVVFDLDTAGDSAQVRGGYVWDQQNFASALALERVRPGSATNPSPFLGNYTLALSPGTNSSQPQGWGHATAKVSAAGVATIAGSLADGTPFTHSAPVIAANGLHPLYASPYLDKGWLYGWLQFQPGNPGGDLQGPLVWRKNGPQAGKPYANGFELAPRVTGSRYTAPSTTNRILDFAEGRVSIEGPNLVGAFTNQVAVGLNNTVTNLSPNKLSFLIAKPSGLFSGSVQPPGETRLIPFKGVTLPALGYGVGYYLSTNQSGRVQFSP